MGRSAGPNGPVPSIEAISPRPASSSRTPTSGPNRPANMFPFTNAPRLPNIGLTSTAGSSGIRDRKNSLSPSLGLGTSMACPVFGPAWSPVVRIFEVEPAARGPFRRLVAGRGVAVSVLKHASQVQQVPGHERGIAVGEVVVRAARPRVEVGRARARRPDPPRVGLRRDRVPQVLQAVQ